jgi:hypothetical protein
MRERWLYMERFPRGTALEMEKEAPQIVLALA